MSLRVRPSSPSSTFRFPGTKTTADADAEHRIRYFSARDGQTFEGIKLFQEANRLGFCRCRWTFVLPCPMAVLALCHRGQSTQLCQRGRLRQPAGAAIGQTLRQCIETLELQQRHARLCRQGLRPLSGARGRKLDRQGPVPPKEGALGHEGDHTSFPGPLKRRHHLCTFGKVLKPQRHYRQILLGTSDEIFCQEQPRHRRRRRRRHYVAISRRWRTSRADD